MIFWTGRWWPRQGSKSRRTGGGLYSLICRAPAQAANGGDHTATEVNAMLVVDWQRRWSKRRSAQKILFVFCPMHLIAVTFIPQELKIRRTNVVGGVSAGIDFQVLTRGDQGYDDL
jgi:hypothetical protein